ncbi:MAG: FG-GAP-like repeat-containing protein, partial [Psychrosphaera sp.]|nr:FG-GAP-like repeat-containing protein [Psychrosphaera sp.]
MSWYNGTTMDTLDTGVPFNCNSLATGTNIRDCSVYIIDINKDGKMDLLTSSQSNVVETPVVSSWTVYLNTHSGSKDTIGQTSFAEGVTLTNSINPIQEAMQVMDIDGDGYDNLVLSQQGKIGRSTDGTNVRAFELNLTNGLLEEMPSYRIDMRANATGGRFVDFNQDGLTDYLYAEYDERYEQFKDAKAWRLRINTGDGFITSDTQSALDTLDLPIGYHVCRNTTTGLDEDSDMTNFVQTVDYNRDGITDILMPGDLVHLSDRSTTGGDCKLGNTFLNHKFDLYKWDLWLGKRGENGTVTYDTAASTSLDVLTPLTDFNLIDFDGDSYVDIVTRLGRTNMNGPAGKTAQGIYVYQNISNTATDLITEITDGMGLLTQFDYGVLSAPIVNGRKLYNNDFADSIFPNVNFTTTDIVVKAMHTTNGFDASKLNTTHFTYSAARFNKEGRGFQGFGVIEEENELAGMTTKTIYNQDYPYSGMVEEQLTYVTGEDDAEKFLSRTLNRKFMQSNPTAPFVVYAEQSGSQSRELAGAGVSPIIKTTSYSTKSLNPRGLPTETSSTVCDGGNLSVDNKGDEDKTNDTLSFTCSTAAPWSKTTSTVIGYKTIENITKPETVTTTATVSYNDDLMATRDHLALVVKKTIVYNDNWTVNSITTTDETVPSGDYAKAPPLTQTSSYYGDTGVPNNANAVGQLYRVTTSSTTAGIDQGIEEDRWVQTQYSADGYFVISTQNSQWGTTVNASA